MLKRTAINILDEKLGAWLETLPLDLALDTKDSIFVAGGAVLSLMRDSVPNDYDVYFKDKRALLAILKYYERDYAEVTFKDILGEQSNRVLMGQPVSLEKKKAYDPIFCTSNALTLDGNIQIIIRYYGSPGNVIRNFDWTHTLCYYDIAEERLSIMPEASRSALANELIYRPGAYPLSSLFRMKKFVERGWNVSIGQMLKLSMQLDLIDYSDSKVLKDQLQGVDVAYVEAFLSKLSNLDNWTTHHIQDLIDEVFGV
jgi:hypothetical protein